MKYGLIQRSMWGLFQHSFREHLSILHITDENVKKQIMKNGKIKYCEIISMIDDFGENDVLLINILSASVFAAIYLSLPENYHLIPVKNQQFFPETEECELLVSGKYTMRELSDFYEYSMNDSFIMKKFLKRSCFSDEFWKKKKILAEKSQKSINPFSWQYTFHPGNNKKHFDAVFTHCGIWYLMKKLGVPEITPALCRYDYGMTKLTDAVFSRNGTLAGGADSCDCHYDKKT